MKKSAVAEPVRDNLMNRRQAFSAALIAGPAAMLANTPQGDRPRTTAKPSRVLTNAGSMSGVIPTS